MSRAERLRRLQFAVDHVARVIEDAPGGEVEDELGRALDHIHLAESALNEEEA